MKKRSLIVILAVLCIATSCFVSSTFAKYTSTVTGEDAATVAKWEWEGVDLANGTVTVNLFDTINDTKDGNDETDVANNLIAPGTKGQFAMTIQNKSEVNATYAIDYTVINESNVPIQFSVDGGTTWTNDLADVETTAANMGSAATTITVMWQWVYETTNGDATDTALGMAENAPTVTVKASITFTQVD